MTIRGYIGQVFEVRPILAGMEDRGLPVDDAARVALAGEFDIAQAALGVELTKAAPASCGRVQPKGGYKGVPPEVKPLLAPGPEYKGLDSALDLRFIEPGDDGESYRYEQRKFAVDIVSDRDGEPAVQLVDRWCRVYDFNPNSAKQLISYMRAMGHPVPKDKHRENDEGENPDTTNKKELVRLANKTGDLFYLKVIEFRELTKAKGTYVEGFKPAADGRVHTTFTFDTAIAQLSSRNPNCFSSDTEVLTKRGWLLFKDLDESDLVAEYNETHGSIRFSKPVSIIFHEYDGVMRHIQTDGQIDLLLTPDHDCLLQDRKTLQFKKIPASLYYKDARQIQAGIYVGGDLHYSEAQITMICALQADGYVIPTQTDKKGRKRGTGGHIQWGFSKDRKITRLRNALTDLEIPFTEHRSKKGTTFYVNRENVPEWLRDKKLFGPWILDLTRESLDYLAIELLFWDGCWERGSNYSSSIRSNTDWAQIVMVLSNRRAKVRLYPGEGNRKDNWQIDISLTHYSSTANHKSEPLGYSGMVYCVTMPWGTVIVRRNGKVAITGNCQNFPKHGSTDSQRRLVRALRKMIAAEPGKILAEWDYKSCHVLTLGFLAEDPNWMRLARLDMHSFIAGHFLGLWDCSKILGETDDELRARFKWLKSDPERKRVRDDPAKHCIAEGELVLTDAGLVPIENITLRHRLWDGVEWVTHGGLLDQGFQEVITYDGLTATPDHQIFADGGETLTMGEAASRMARLCVTGDGGTAVRSRCHRLVEDQTREWIYPASLSVPDMREGEVDSQGQLEEAGWVPVLLAAEVYPPTRSGEALRRHHSAVQQSQESCLQALRRAWNRMPVLIASGFCVVGGAELASQGLPWSGDRPQRQRWALRSWEPASSDATGTDVEQARHSQDVVSWAAYYSRRVRKSLRAIVDWAFGEAWDDRRADHPARRETRTTRKGEELAALATVARFSRVYDIANAGPRRRFTVSGRLVHNCILGIGNGLKARGAYERYMENFPPRPCQVCAGRRTVQGVRGPKKCPNCKGLGMESGQRIADRILEICEQFSPKVFAYQRREQERAHKEQCLKTDFGHLRRFYEVFRWDPRRQQLVHGDQAEEAVSYRLSNVAHAHMRESMKALARLGHDERYGLCDQIHDALLFHFDRSLLDDHIRDIYPVLVAPSAILRHPTIAPGGLTIDVEAKAGRNWADRADDNPDGMAELALPKKIQVDAAAIAV